MTRPSCCGSLRAGRMLRSLGSGACKAWNTAQPTDGSSQRAKVRCCRCFQWQHERDEVPGRFPPNSAHRARPIAAARPFCLSWPGRFRRSTSPIRLQPQLPSCQQRGQAIPSDNPLRLGSCASHLGSSVYNRTWHGPEPRHAMPCLSFFCRRALHCMARGPSPLTTRWPVFRQPAHADTHLRHAKKTVRSPRKTLSVRPLLHL